MTDRFLNEQWADSFVMHYTADWPQPETDEGVKRLCKLREDAIEVLAAKLNGDKIPAHQREGGAL
jgi:hypothetical protein